MSKFKVGDLVSVNLLNGPNMIIINICLDNNDCMWFDRNHRLQTGTFRTNMLVKVHK